MFIKCLINIFVVLLFSTLNAQSSSDVKNLLRNAGVSRSAAEKLIQKEIGNNRKLKEKEPVQNNLSSDESRNLNLNFSANNEVNAKLEKEILTWDPPSVELFKNLNTSYTFKDSTYKWNGRLWILDKAIDDEAKKIKIKHFGYEVFESNPRLFQNFNFSSVGPNYVVGPGDEIIIMLWGQTEINAPYIVSKEGYIFIQNLGQVFVNGLTLEKLDKKLFKLLKKVYSSLDNSTGPASTFLDVSLGSTINRPLRVFVVGEVLKSGAYDLDNSATLFSSLYYFSGPTTNGSLRDIKLIRNGKEVGSIDFYDFLLTGKKNNDVKLQQNDVIFVPTRGKTISVDGEIMRPAIFELSEEENLGDLIQMAGGLLPTTYMDRLTIRRIIPHSLRSPIGSLEMIDLDLNNQLEKNFSFNLEDGDKLVFEVITKKYSNKIGVQGAVKRPGEYSLSENMTISNLIDKAGGLSGQAFLESAYITSLNNDLSKSLVKINLKKALDGDSDHNIILKNDDQVVIYNDNDMSWKTSVSIEGHVLNPGSKDYKKDMNVFDLIFLGGGFENENHLKTTHLERAEYSFLNEDGVTYSMIPFRLDSVLTGGGISNKKLSMGDKIRIYSKNEIVGRLGKNIKIEGYVKRPGDYTLYDDMNISDLLFMAGGLDDPVHLSKTHLKRADIIRTDDNLIDKNIIKVNLADLLDGGIFPEPNLKNDDVIRVYSASIFRKNKFVNIDGIIKSPGRYELKQGMSLSDLILEAGGLTSISSNYRVEIASIVAGNEDIKEVKIKTYDFKVDLKNIINDRTNSIILKPFDVVTLREDPYFGLQKTISIKGEVLYPGSYVISKSEELISDIINRAGGITEAANAKASTLIRNGETIKISFEKIIKNPRSRTNIKIISGDIIKIGTYTDVVKVTGAVYNPGNFQYVKGLDFRDYIKNAGGYTENADKFRSYVRHPDGSSDVINFLNMSPKIYDGSEIVIIKKVDNLPFDFTEYATRITQIWADLTQAYLVILTATRL